MIYYASFYPNPRNDKGLPLPHLHWFELAKTDWAHIYRTTGTPCSCIVCRRAKYSRLEYKRDTARIIRETEEQQAECVKILTKMYNTSLVMTNKEESRRLK